MRPFSSLLLYLAVLIFIYLCTFCIEFARECVFVCVRILKALVVFRCCRETRAHAPHVELQHGLPGVAVLLPQRRRRPDPRVNGEYVHELRHSPADSARGARRRATPTVWRGFGCFGGAAGRHVARALPTNGNAPPAALGARRCRRTGPMAAHGWACPACPACLLPGRGQAGTRLAHV